MTQDQIDEILNPLGFTLYFRSALGDKKCYSYLDIEFGREENGTGLCIDVYLRPETNKWYCKILSPYLKRFYQIISRELPFPMKTLKREIEVMEHYTVLCLKNHPF